MRSIPAGMVQIVFFLVLFLLLHPLPKPGGSIRNGFEIIHTIYFRKIKNIYMFKKKDQIYVVAYIFFHFLSTRLMGI
jgi:hypothetical protein